MQRGLDCSFVAESASGRTIPSRSDPWSTCSVGSVAERSKALDLGSSLFGGVGSNPTAASCGFNQGWEALRVLEMSLKIL